jgi:hypothetical protein
MRTTAIAAALFAYTQAAQVKDLGDDNSSFETITASEPVVTTTSETYTSDPIITTTSSEQTIVGDSIESGSAGKSSVVTTVSDPVITETKSSSSSMEIVGGPGTTL